ncbi:hypothetical protein GGI13_001501 [Coemansia sp. RSA 455]|nr:hypothetical protein GGI13_001501 [Coemansia sp. RSA 455]
MHSTLQRPHLHSRQPQPSALSLSSSSSSSTGGRVAAVYRRAEDSDDIDDILGSLWPTGATTLYLHRHQPLQESRPLSAQSYLTSSLSSGQCTPPEDMCPRVAPVTTVYSHRTTEQSDKNIHSEYALVTPSVTASSSSAQVMTGAPASGRSSVSASIQIGDPEWRVDSPQSMARPLHHLPKLPSPVSPITPAAYHQHCPYPVVESRDAGTTRIRPLLPNLGLAMPRRMQASARSVTLGSAGQPPLLPPSLSLPARVVTPAERVARLHTVSGLAARAVARRCMSAHSSVLPAGFGCVEETVAMPESYSHLATRVTNGKPTFADVAKSSQEPAERARRE